MGRPDSELYRGARLTQALDWRAHHDTALTSAETAFLDAAEKADAIEQRSAAERARQQARLIRRLRGVLAGATVLLIAALIAGGLAVQQQGKAEDSAASALAAETAAVARHAGALALSTDDLDESILLAAAGVRLDDSPQTRSSLLAALGRNPELIASTQMAGSAVLSFDVSPDGRTVAAYDRDNHVRLYEIGTGELLEEYQAGSVARHQWLTGQARFSPDGRVLAVVMSAPTRQPVMLLDANTLEPLPVQPGGLPRLRWQLLDLAYSADGLHLAATMWRVRGSGTAVRSTSTWAFVWDLGAPRHPSSQLTLPDGNAGVALSADGRVLYTTAPFTRHDLMSGASVPVDIPASSDRMALSPDGQLLAAAGGGGLLLLDAATGELRRTLEGNGEDGWIVNFSPDGRLVATVTWGGEALVWGVSTGELRASLPLGEAGDPVDFGADGSTLYTAGTDSALRHWDLDGDRRFIAQVASAGPELGDESFVQPAPGGELIAYPKVPDSDLQDVTPSASHVAFLDVSAGTVGVRHDRGTGYRPLHGEGSWHPDAEHYALAAGGEIRIWNAVTDELTQQGRPSGRYSARSTTARTGPAS